MARTGLTAEEVAFIGDDTNDVEILGLVGLSACPGDATSFARAVADFHCQTRRGPRLLPRAGRVHYRRASGK